jgi:short-subunit dehydrogenase
MPLEGKTALITGAGAGIGRALAIEASRRGMIIALVGRRVATLHETRACLTAQADCLIIPGDVTVPETRRAIRDQLAEEWGLLHILVNNAGIVLAGPLAEAQDEELNRLMATNFVAPIALTREMLPLLRVGAPARIVNLGSMFGDIAFPLFAAYSASKFALRGLSNAFRRELKSLGIGVTYAAPRGARTDATRAIARFVEAFAMPLDSADRIGRQIWDAVAQGTDTVYPRGRERLFVLAERLFPSVVNRAIASQLEKSGLQKIIETSDPWRGPLAPHAYRQRRGANPSEDRDALVPGLQ